MTPTSEDQANSQRTTRNRRVEVSVRGRVVLRRRDAEKFLESLAEELVRQSPIPLDFTHELERLKGAVVSKRRTALEPGLHELTVTKNGREQPFVADVVRSLAEGLLPKTTPGRAVPERAQEILRAVKVGNRWRDPRTGHFTLDPTAVKG